MPGQHRARLNHVVIVPGFAESKAHFMRLIKLLEKHNYTWEVIYVWQHKKLNKRKGKAVFLAHSMGTHYASRYKLRPVLLVGVIYPHLLTQNYFKSVTFVTKYSWEYKVFLYHLKLRAMNGLNIIRYFPYYLRYALPLPQTTDTELKNGDVIVVKNDSDMFSAPDGLYYSEPGHHDDILYNPDRYLPYIEQLAQRVQ